MVLLTSLIEAAGQNAIDISNAVTFFTQRSGYNLLFRIVFSVAAY